MDYIIPITLGLIFVTISYLYLNGYFRVFILIIKNFNSINETFKKLNITPELVEQSISMFNNFNFDNTEMLESIINHKTLKTSKKQTYISESGKCIHIYYDYEGKEYMLTVPFDRISLVDMLQYQMDAIYENGDILTITQQPGIPYLVNTNDLKCKTLKAINHETDVYHEYKDDTNPYFCGEICDI